MSNTNPEFIIIAGPNGAGKSTTSKELLSSKSKKGIDYMFIYLPKLDDLPPSFIHY